MVRCAKCSAELSDHAVYDRTPCPSCGNLITAYLTDPQGKRMSLADHAVLANESRHLRTRGN